MYKAGYLAALLLAIGSLHANANSLAESLGEITVELDQVEYAGLDQIELYFDTRQTTALTSIHLASRHQARYDCGGPSDTDSGTFLTFDDVPKAVPMVIVDGAMLEFIPGAPVALHSVEGDVLCLPVGDTVFEDDLDHINGS